MDWIIFWDHFVEPFNGGGKHTISSQGGLGCSLSVLKGGRRQSIITQGGVGDVLLRVTLPNHRVRGGTRSEKWTP